MRGLLSKWPAVLVTLALLAGLGYGSFLWLKVPTVRYEILPPPGQEGDQFAQGAEPGGSQGEPGQMPPIGQGGPAAPGANSPSQAPGGTPGVAQTSPGFTSQGTGRTGGPASGRPLTGGGQRGTGPGGGATSNTVPSSGGASRPSPQMRPGAMEFFQVLGLMGGIGRLETEGKQPLSATQARKVLTAIAPLRKAGMPDEQTVKTALAGLKGALTEAQLTLMRQPPPGGFGGPGGGNRGTGGSGGAMGGNRGPGGGMGGPPGGMGGGPGRPGGPGGPGGGQRMNPFDPANTSPFAQFLKDLVKKLEAKAK